MIQGWKVIHLGRGYFDFAFQNNEDLRIILVAGSWSLNPRILRLTTWKPDFNPRIQRNTVAQVWTCILDLPLEYWSPDVLFSIVSRIGVPISIDTTTLNLLYGHFARVLVEINLEDYIPDQILVEREKYFLVSLSFENLPEFCFSCGSIGHVAATCRKTMIKGDMQDQNSKNNRDIGIAKKSGAKSGRGVIRVDITPNEDVAVDHDLDKDAKDSQDNSGFSTGATQATKKANYVVVLDGLTSDPSMIRPLGSAVTAPTTDEIEADMVIVLPVDVGQFSQRAKSVVCNPVGVELCQAVADLAEANTTVVSCVAIINSGQIANSN
uniref:CCHC-type domain-containing protein n=1 Tax=Cajanus cajan TaxID=3821 RepID=A0A151SMG2_CAJCA|nr:hypothetical protein KK1_002243 [Cajanus cajan]